MLMTKECLCHVYGARGDKILSKHFWTEAVRIACYTQNRSIIVKRHDKTPYEIFRVRILNISYFIVLGCPVFIHNYKDHLGKFDAKADDGYFLGYSFVSKDFRVFNTRRQQVEETYHVTFDESMEAIRFNNTSEYEIGIDDSSRYPPDEFIHEDDPSRQYQTDSGISYYVIPHGRSLSEITQENHVPEVIAPNEPDIPLTEDTEGPPDLINTEGTHEQNVQNEQIITQPTEGPIGNNTEVSVSINESLVRDVSQSHISNQASTIAHPVPQDRCMAANLTAASASECLFSYFLSKIEPKKLSEALKHLGWVDAMQEELNQFYRNKVWTLVPLPYGKTAIGSKWVFRNKKDKHVVRMEAIRIFLAFATYINFKVYQMDVKSAFLNADYGLKQAPKAWYETLSTFLIQNKFTRGRIDNTLFIYKSKGDVLLVQVMMGELTYFLGLQIKQDDKGISICQEQFTRNLLKKYEIFDSSSVKTPMVPPNNLGSDLAGKPVNETSYRRMIGSLMYLTATRPNIQFSIVLCVRYQSNPKESHLTAVKRILRHLKAKAEYVAAAGCCASILWMKSQLSDYDIHYKMVPIFYDNTSAIAISNNPVLHSRTKHIDIRYHFMRDHILIGDIELHFIPTEY
ncbi:retrovirus-related pol polyprotein from transposon TNT 1-94 [Tanacetum coccineum]